VTDEQRGRRPIFIATLWAGAIWLFFFRRGGFFKARAKRKHLSQYGSTRLGDFTIRQDASATVLVHFGSSH
jgi:hypothetical protein